MLVYQAAKFSTNAKHYHDNAVKLMGRCLKETNYKGLILKLDLNKVLNAHVDADFAGAHNEHDSKDPLTVHSTSGFIIKQQTEK